MLIVRANEFVALEEFIAAQKQLGEVHDAFALALPLVLDVKRLRRLVTVAARHLARAQSVLLAPIDEVLHVLRIGLLRIDVGAFITRLMSES